MSEYPVNEKDENEMSPAPEAERAPEAEKPATGEYRYVRPNNGEHYTDAQYIPRDQAPNTPRHYSYVTEETRPKEKTSGGKKPRRRTGLVVALCLVCILLGAAAGVFGAVHWENWFLRDPQGEENYPVEITPAPTAVPATPIPTAAPKADGLVMDPSALYDMACTQVVGVTTEVTTYNRFGMPSAGSVVGSGFIISEDGYILTNQHILSGTSAAEVILPDGTACDALLIGEDATTDLAVLKIDAAGLQPAEFGDSDELTVGDSVAAIGNPLTDNLSGTLTDGIVSAINRTMSSNGYTMTLIQTTAALNEGNSGGPLFNSFGQVVGITNMKMVNNVSGVAVEGIGFAIPSTTAKQVVDQLIEKGVCSRPGMGITVGAIPTEAAEHYDLPEGLYITAVSEGSSAKARGVRPGDVLLKVDGIDVRSSSDVLAIRDTHVVGDDVVLTIYRGGKTFDITITLNEYGELY